MANKNIFPQGTAILFFLVALLSCSNNSSSNISTPSANFEGFEELTISGSDFKRLIKKGPEQKPLEEGTTLHNLRNGNWITYHPKDGYIETITTYIDGMKEGVYLKFSNRGQIDEKAFYSKDLLDGPRATYKFGRPVEVMNYVQNQLDGTKFIYHTTGKVQQEINFKNGMQDGVYRYFDEAGTMTLDYFYKDGEKISGGMVEKD